MIRSAAPLLLAVESATSTLSVALFRGEQVLALRAPTAGGHHAESLLPLIDELLAEAGVQEREVQAFAVSIGPGSFTSLRVGLATVKGLVFRSERLTVAVPTLEALAFTHAAAAAESGPGLPCAALLDARRGEVYAAVFDLEAERPREIVPAGLFAPADLAAVLPTRCVLVGEGAPFIASELRRRVGGGISAPSNANGPPSAAAVGVLGARALSRGETDSAADLAPRYVRRAEAEVTRTRLRVEDPNPSA